MSYKIALVTKTYKNDIPLCKALFDSINTYNFDKIPYYIIAPQSDRELLENTLGTEGYTFISDEEVHTFENKMYGWEQQMIIKLEMYKKVDAKNYLILDSDARFIRPFTEADFIAYDSTPYTIVHENKQVAEYETVLKNGDYFNSGYAKAVKAYRQLFGYKSRKIYDYGPNPHLWNRRVLLDFQKGVLDFNKLTIEELCMTMKSAYQVHFRETLTYGEYLMSSKVIEVIPSGPLFKTYHWKEMVEFEKGTGLELEENIAKNYLGIIMQNKHT